MTEKQKTARFEIDFQDTNVPVYTDFKNIREGFVVLCGKNIKNSNIIFPGKIIDKNGVETKYRFCLPTSLPDYSEIKEVVEKSFELPQNSIVWFLGYFKSGTIRTFNFGTIEDFPYPNLLTV